MSGRDQTRSDAIQILRGLAALGVLEVHCAAMWLKGPSVGAAGLPALGAFGVDIFFVISGFVMVGVAGRSPTALAFLRQRFLRVVPLYWLYSAPWIGFALGGGTFSVPGAVRTFLFWLGIGREVELPVLGGGWTLCFEVWFYIAMAAALAFGARAWALCGAVWLACFLLAWRSAAPVFEFPGSPLFLEFGIGALLALRPTKIRPRLGLAVMVLTAAALVAVESVVAPHGVLNAYQVFAPRVGLEHLAVFGPAAGLFVWGALQLEPFARRAKALIFLGDASYSLYLAHPLGVLAAYALAGPTGWPSWLLALVAATLSIAAGVASYRWIERGMLTRLRRPSASPVFSLAWRRRQALSEMRSQDCR